MQEAIRLVETIEPHMERTLREISSESRAILIQAYGLKPPADAPPTAHEPLITEATLRSARREFSYRLEMILQDERRGELQRGLDLQLILKLFEDLD